MSPSKESTQDTDAYPPQAVYSLRDFTSPAASEPFYQNYQFGVPIALDIGSSQVRIGLTNSTLPNNVFPSTTARYKDRKTGQMLTLVGNDVYRDPLSKSSIRTIYDGTVITNWDHVEYLLDYSFEHLGVHSDNGRVDNPIIMTEPVTSTVAQRKGMYELLFEVYQAPKVTFGIDSLFSYYANCDGKPNNGLVVGGGNESTHLFPVLDGRGVLSQTKRIDWGGNQSQQFLSKLLALKYPYFPSKLTPAQTTLMFQDFSYISDDYQEELKHFLDMDQLETKDVVIQAPVDLGTPEKKKTEQELAQQAERRREQGRRLQEQARQRRAEKLVQKEEELAYFVQLKQEFEVLSEVQIQKKLEAENFEDINDFNKYITGLEKSIKKQKYGEDDDSDDEIDPLTAWPLVDIPDDQLSPENIKEKRKQRLHKANFDARQKNIEAKKQEEELKAQYEKEQAEFREKDLEGWCSTKRIELAKFINRIKERQKILDSFKDRKSVAAQQRMKNIADLANDESGSTNANSRKRRRNATSTIDNDPNDTFGANDDDWNLYRDISNVNLEEEQAEDHTSVLALEAELLDHDPNFHHEDTLAATSTFDWKNSALHKFIHGPRPNISLAMQIEGIDPDEIATKPEIILKNHQLHLNVERIRVPEILFEPHIAGLDQAGISEISQDLFLRRLDGNFKPGGQSYNVVQDIFITGGLSRLPNFDTRIVKEFTSFLPVGAPIRVRKARDPTVDPWKGMQLWSSTNECESSYVTKAEYDEYGPEYIKEHGLGNVSLL
ncbi:Nuclear actin-protein involved in chromatin remodeling [Yamadazyma tenuis]|uniref:Actin-like ATPase domain-containing protein n=1 Tax=Candida tenuis (strain ATCC 10573 / BCRC 21748 / CBS 615 / JCM 9827 / NBRC 10315 / NRRL Y-1498 / VKM Y-70) TaxID=590646 RepID=G3BF48_CANTC|nr:actin-like ATPase domain-containing protein [Yamadazyma tenuis ATCC 10573]EGV60634.1 actin-like ATPase domain-containing protein [Yamadazyma tenuis ATCC 10573]WEJ94118.1 Nuclear actin-protein involved in chromatin remodeling [Yamadazyma tenuis]